MQSNPNAPLAIIADDQAKIFLRLLAIALLGCITGAFSGSLQAAISTELTTVRDVRALTPDQARAARPVRLRGVVTVLSGWKASFFFQDETSGISVDRVNPLPPLEAGQVVEVRGVTGPGLFAPTLVAEEVRVIGKRPMPTARFFDLSRLAGGKQDSQWIAIRGLVRSAGVQLSWGHPVLFLEIDIGGGNLITARVHDYSKANLDELPGATVSVRGVCGTVFNDKRQFVGLRLFVSSLNDLTVERPASIDPYDIPTRPLGSLLQFSDAGGALARVKVRGIVTYSQPGKGLYIQDGLQGVFVQSAETTQVALGTELEVVGYPAAGRYSPKLEYAVFRVVGSISAVAGVSREASSMIVEKDGFTAAPYDSVLVQLKGRLIEQVQSGDEYLLHFQNGTSIFSARLSRTARGDNGFNLTPGSLMSITGICSVKADEAHEASSFEIVLRSAADLVEIERAPWWTASHAAWVVTLLVLVVLGMSAWLFVVRRQAGLRVLTITDPLSGLYNRRGFHLLAEQQWRLSLRGKKPLLLFYIDVDHFKNINDTLGHKEGDLAIQAVSAVLRECFRKTDIIGRLGGDEFAVAAVEVSESGRAVLELRLLKTLQQSNETPGRAFHLSLSVGVLTCDKTLEHLAIEGLLDEADALMYQKKRGSMRTFGDAGQSLARELQLQDRIC